MDFFTRAMDTLSVAGKGVSKKANEISTITKANLRVVNTERDLKELFEQLGQKFYETYPEQATELFANMVGKIEKKTEQLEREKEALAKLKGQKVCPHCGEIISATAKFCEKCGKDAIVVEQIQDETGERVEKTADEEQKQEPTSADVEQEVSKEEEKEQASYEEIYNNQFQDESEEEEKQVQASEEV